VRRLVRTAPTLHLQWSPPELDRFLLRAHTARLRLTPARDAPRVTRLGTRFRALQGIAALERGHEALSFGVCELPSSYPSSAAIRRAATTVAHTARVIRPYGASTPSTPCRVQRLLVAGDRDPARRARATPVSAPSGASEPRASG
jgi:hypothetical protein